MRLKVVVAKEPKTTSSPPLFDASCEATHPQVHPLVQHPLAVKLTQQAGGGDAEDGVRCGAPSTGHITEEVVSQLPQQPGAAQQRDRCAGLNTTEG